MLYLRVNINKNNSITEISGSPFSGITKGGQPFNNLESDEIQAETNYNFPTGQKPFFYRWNGLDVEVNDEDTINSFYEKEGSLSGLDLEPHIELVVGADFIPDSTKVITIKGVNFSPFSVIEVSGDENFVNTVYFDTPKQIRVEITVGNIEGLFNLIVKNDNLHSKDSGYNKLSVKSKTVIDLRTANIGDLGLEMTSGISVQQDNSKGLRFYSYTSSWNRGVKFSSYFWNRNDDITYEMIFTRTSDVNFMIGIASASLNVSNINSAYYKQEIGIYHNNNKLTSVYGGGDVSNWSQPVGTTIIFDRDKYYKIKFENSGSEGARCSVWEVDPDDWDNETEIHSWESTCPADDLILTPFLIPQASSGSYYITGFRF